jgi:hypothetical protein
MVKTLLLISRIEKAIREEDIYEPIIDVEHQLIEDKDALNVFQLYTNNSNMKEKKNDALKVLDSSQKKLKTVQFFKKQNTIIEVTPFE